MTMNLNRFYPDLGIEKQLLYTNTRRRHKSCSKAVMQEVRQSDKHLRQSDKQLGSQTSNKAVLQVARKMDMDKK